MHLATTSSARAATSVEGSSDRTVILPAQGEAESARRHRPHASHEWGMHALREKSGARAMDPRLTFWTRRWMQRPHVSPQRRPVSVGRAHAAEGSEEREMEQPASNEHFAPTVRTEPRRGRPRAPRSARPTPAPWHVARLLRASPTACVALTQHEPAPQTTRALPRAPHRLHSAPFFSPQPASPWPTGIPALGEAWRANQQARRTVNTRACASGCGGPPWGGARHNCQAQPIPFRR